MDDGAVTQKNVELEFMGALHRAGENWGEIVEIAATAPDRDEAIRQVMDRLQIAEQPARAVLHLRLEELTVAARAAVHARYRAASAE